MVAALSVSALRKSGPIRITIHRTRIDGQEPSEQSRGPVDAGEIKPSPLTRKGPGKG